MQLNNMSFIETHDPEKYNFDKPLSREDKKLLEEMRNTNQSN